MRLPWRRVPTRLHSVLRGLRFKATVAVTAFVVMISVVLTTLFVMYVEQTERQAVARQAGDVASLLSLAVARGVALEKPELLTGPLEAAREKSHIRYVAIYDHQSLLAGEADPTGTGLPLPSPSGTGTVIREISSSGAEPVLDVIAPIFAGPAAPLPPERESAGVAERVPLGWVRVGFSLHATDARMAQFRSRARGIAVIVILLGTLGTMFLVGTIVGPIQELARATERIASGDFDVHVESGSPDELGILSRSFNEMAYRLQRASQRRESWGRELESRVTEKTQEIEETKNHLTNIVENVGASILVADLDGSIVSSNSHTMHIFGIKPERIVGRSLQEFTCDPSVGTKTFESLLGGEPLVYDAKHQLDRNREMDLLITLTVLRSADDRAAGFLQITKDITPLKTMERRMLESERLSAMGEMAGEIGHELNNYMAAISGRSELIGLALERGNEKLARETARIIAEQVGKMRVLTDGLLQSARTESSPQPLDLNETVRQAVEFVGPQKRFQRIDLDLALSPSPVPVCADSQQIQQVIFNLLANGADAVRSTPHGRGRLRIETERTNDTATLRITDDGVGIHPEILPRVLEPRFTTKPTGHGFGLAVCHRVITTHSGHIEIDSQPGQGTKITVSLPLLEDGSPTAARVDVTNGATLVG